MSFDPRQSGIRAAVEWAQVDGGEFASRQGRGVCGWINEKVPGAAQVVLTDETLIYRLRAGQVVFVSQYCFAVETTSDDCQFEFGYIDSLGAFVPRGPHKHVYTGAANSGRTAYDQDIAPAMRLAYSDGVRTITFRVDANDASCEITCGWHGWWEEE